jgi:hypothetical protein
LLDFWFLTLYSIGVILKWLLKLYSDWSSVLVSYITPDSSIR